MPPATVISALCAGDIALRAVISSLCSGDIATALRLRKILAYSKCTYTQHVPIRRRNWSRKATTAASAELSSHTSSFCFNHNKLQLFALALCAPLPTRQKTSLSSLIYKHKFACFCRAGALVCVVQATAPCCCVAGAQRTVA